MERRAPTASRIFRAVGAQIQVTDANGTWTARAGTARADGSAPVPQAGLFRAGSATKMFTAVVLMQLVGEGKVLLDTPLERYVSTELVPAAERITVRMLGPDSRYGLGLKQERLSCGRLAVGQTGGIPGYATLAFTTPDRSCRVVLSANLADWPADPSIGDPIDKVLDDAVCG
ncbi:serine hydrolase [Streptomyces chrestomyceticus]|uniref:serine hydrolase n=1 Tax=Streptomyces chrestomyceticus TaxID=68185 RepID=UPI0027D93672|nr:serine hydrolase domain-containing protein [Streptomyces chrestomyceticus]